MAYSYGLRENELDNATPEFFGLFLAGHIARENEKVKAGWEQARFIASAMSREAAKFKFPWERIKRILPEIPQSVWDKFTPNTTGISIEAKDIKKYVT